MTWTPPTLADLDDMARRLLDELPATFKRFTKDLVVQVMEFPDDDVCREMELETPFDILGLYQGIALDQTTADASGTLPDMVFLYRRPILDYWCEGGFGLEQVVRHVLIHEIGHHFGLSDGEMEAIEDAEAQVTSA